VTGSGRGIGKAIALRFAREGADVVINFFRNREPAEQTAEQVRELGRRAVVVKANVGELDDLNRLFDTCDEAFGRLDYYIHNAASGYNRPILGQKPRGWEWTMNINARSLVFAAQKAVPLMTRFDGGAIVAMSSLGSIRVLPEYAVVGASKAALEALVRYLGVELAPLKVRVNGISPGIVETEALRYFDYFSEDAARRVEKIRSETPVGRLCTPEDVAELVSFLCGPQATMLCGQTILLDGGYSLMAGN
jgi:enoyl-[acyl-carrier protein] reductase III